MIIAKYGFYLGFDQYLFKMLLGPLQNFWMHDASDTIKYLVFAKTMHRKKSGTANAHNQVHSGSSVLCNDVFRKDP